jgi:hypothetical protein
LDICLPVPLSIPNSDFVKFFLIVDDKHGRIITFGEKSCKEYGGLIEELAFRESERE